MKSKRNANTTRRLGALCQGSCQKVLSRVRNAKNRILAEALTVIHTPERMLQLALNEADALAWQTPYPHLFFPELASEKIQAVARWSDRQRAVHGLQTPCPISQVMS